MTPHLMETSRQLDEVDAVEDHPEVLRGYAAWPKSHSWYKWWGQRFVLRSRLISGIHSSLWGAYNIRPTLIYAYTVLCTL